MDMSPSFIAGAKKAFPKATIVFDHFHIMQMAGKMLDLVRKELLRQGFDLKGSMWSIRGNAWTRSAEQLEKRKSLCSSYPVLARALLLRDLLQDFLGQGDEGLLDYWCKRAMSSRLEPFKVLARSIRAHRAGIVAFMKTRVTNGLIEAINGLLQLAKRLARGFRSLRNFKTMAYLKAGRLKLDLPQFRPV